jgi:hypothetical protein
LKKALISALIIVILSPAFATSQTRRRSAPRRSASASKAAEKVSAEKNAAREQVAAQIKALTRFLYLFAGITKGIESSDQEARSAEVSTVAVDHNERNKAKVRESLRTVRQGLDKLEIDFSSRPSLRGYYPYVIGVASMGEAAESQAASNRFDEAGRSLLKAVTQLTDALAAMR